MSHALVSSARVARQTLSEFFGVPVHAAAPTLSHWLAIKDPLDCVETMAAVEEEARRAGKPGVLLSIADNGVVISLLSAFRRFNEAALDSVLTRWAEFGFVDIQAQIAIESILLKTPPAFLGSILTKDDRRVRDPQAFLAQEKPSDAACWQPFFNEKLNGFTSTDCRAITQLWSAAWVRQNPQKAPDMFGEAIGLALNLAGSGVPLPKPGVPTPLTRPQANFDRVAQRCQVVVNAIQSQREAIGLPRSDSWAPPELGQILAAFSTKKKALEAVKPKNKPAASANGAAKPALISPDAQGRREAMISAAKNLDVDHFSWLLSHGLPGSAWMPRTVKESGNGVLEALCGGVYFDSRPDSAIKAQPRTIKERSALAARLFTSLVETGLDLIQEAPVSLHRTDNVFLRARHALVGADPSGELSQAWVDALIGQLGSKNVSLSDASALLDEALAFPVRGAKDEVGLFMSVARARLEQWHLRAEIAGAPANEGKPFAQPARRPRAL